MAVVSILRKLPRYMTSPRGGVPAGLRPSYNIDFTKNRADIGGKITTIADIPSISGTLDLSSSGHLVDGADNGLIIPLSGVTYPLTFLVEFVRNADSGVAEVLALLDDGSANNMSAYRIETTDLTQFRVTTAAALVANVTCSGNLASVPTTVRRAAGRVSTNSVQASRNVGPVGGLGTEDTSAAVPANPTRLVVGVDSAGAQTFTGYIRKIKIYPVAATNAQLQALATVA